MITQKGGNCKKNRGKQKKAAQGLNRTCLKGRYASHEKLISRDIILGKLGADIGLRQTGPNLQPMGGIGDVVLEPVGEAVEAVLPVSPAGNGITAIATSDEESTDEKDEKQGYEDGHTEKIESQKALLVPISTHKAGEGDQQDEDAEQDDGPSEGVDALVVGLRGQPDPGSYDGYGAEQGYEVHHCCYVVAHSHGATAAAEPV